MPRLLSAAVVMLGFAASALPAGELTFAGEARGLATVMRRDLPLLRSWAAVDGMVRAELPRPHPRASWALWLGAMRTGLDPRLLLAVLIEESAGDHLALSRRGAVGLMQVRRAVWERALRLGLVNLYDVRENVAAGAVVLAYYVRQTGSYDAALARYSGGAAGYPERVLRRWAMLRERW